MTWIIDGRKFAKKVKHAASGSGSSCEIDANEATRKLCPACRHAIGNNGQEWPGLPAGVKFDPNDAEILDHLAGKLGKGDAKPHPFIDEFIPTLEGDTGICYTHPEKLPGVNRDGRASHFFHRPANAYTKGTRKRRKVHTGEDEEGGETRWHKTGKTRAVLDSGVLVGWKKIMVLYTNFKKSAKPTKTNWVMHQYHLGTQEDEREGELVVSKVFYQTQPRTSKKAGASDDEDDRAENMTNFDILTQACVDGPCAVSRPVPSTPDTLVRPLASREPRLVAEAQPAAMQSEVTLSVPTPECTFSTISGPVMEEEAEAGNLPVPNDPLDEIMFLRCDEELPNGDPLLTNSQMEDFAQLAADCWLHIEEPPLQPGDFGLDCPVCPPIPEIRPPLVPELQQPSHAQDPLMSSQEWLDWFLRSSQETAADSQSGNV